MLTTAKAPPATAATPAEHPAQPNVKDALDHARTAAQELHGALSDAVTRRGGAVKADLEALPLKARAIAQSVAGSLDAQATATKHTLADAIAALEATATHAAQALKSSGHAAEQAISDARASVEKISEAVAAKRAALSK